MTQTLGSGRKKSYVLDTSILINNPDVLETLNDCNIYIPFEVLEELDNLKIKNDSSGMAARFVNRSLDSLRGIGNLLNGIEYKGKKVFVIPTNKELVEEKNDNRIISVAQRIYSLNPEVTLLTDDIAMRVKCDSLGIRASSLTGKDELSFSLYSGFHTMEVSKGELDDYHIMGYIQTDEKLYSNQGVVLKSDTSSGVGLYDGNGKIKKFLYAGKRGFELQGISPRSKEQLLSCELLLDPDVNLVTMVGSSGTGKTLLAAASAIHCVQEGLYKKMIISRPVQSTSKDIGYLPGTKEEKMAPWIQPIFDNLEVLFSNRAANYLEMMMKNKIIEVEALSYIRGRSLPDTVFIVDEAQNITQHEAKALLTRMGENSKLILIGDLDQIDSMSITKASSGLYNVIEKFKDFSGAGHVTLTKGERSKLATFAAKVL